MLKSLYIKNFIIIDEINLDFNPGFSVFTGETGAGKSIIVDAIDILTGSKCNSSIIRKGESQAIIEGVFDFSDHLDVIEKIKEYGFDTSEDIVITREVNSDGKNTCRINHRVCNLSIIKEILFKSIDIHSQHDNQYLLQKGYHITLLDSYLSDDSLVENVAQLYKTYNGLLTEKDRATQEEYNLNDLEYFNHIIEEINDVDFKDGEDERLEEQDKNIQNISKNYDLLKETIELYDGVLTDNLYSLTKNLENVKSESINAVGNEINSHIIDIEDLFTKVKDTFDSFDMSEDDINAIEERLFTINKLKRKYGNTYEKVMETLSDTQNKIDLINNRQEYLDNMNKKVDEAYAAFEKEASKLSNKRIKASKDLDQSIMKYLKELMLPNAKFKTIIKTDKPSRHGLDNVEFMISMNAGEDLMPLTKVASGGELSRLMLGLKTVFTSLQKIDTVIFDEIDSGVSGKVASSIGKCMYELSRHAQVFAITHLSPVASYADHHFVVSKLQDKKTTTKVEEVIGDKVINELSLIATGNTSKASLDAAKELVNNAKKEKNG